VQSIKHDVARAVYTMLQALTVFRDRTPLTDRADRAGHEFNALLERARYSFPASPAIECLQPLEADARLATVLTRLSALKGAIDTELIRVGEAAVIGVTYAFWRHPSGGVYAVELLYGQLRGCCTVRTEDADLDVLPFLPYEKGDTFQWVREHREEFMTAA
jgi:hypothetical protein